MRRAGLAISAPFPLDLRCFWKLSHFSNFSAGFFTEKTAVLKKKIVKKFLKFAKIYIKLY